MTPNDREKKITEFSKDIIAFVFSVWQFEKISLILYCWTLGNSVFFYLAARRHIQKNTRIFISKRYFF